MTNERFAEIHVITSRLDTLREAWEPRAPLPEFEAAFDELLYDNLTEAFPPDMAPWAYDWAACPCVGRIPNCSMCGGDGKVCPNCAGAGFVISHNKLEECNCGLAADTYLKALVNECSFTEEMTRWTFDQTMIQVPGYAELSEKVQDWLKDALLRERGWLFINSLHGRGKSFFGACAINWARMGGVEGVFFTAPELEEFLRDRIPAGARYGTFLEWLSAIKSCPLLVLDEYGAEFDSKWVDVKFRDILEYRSDRGGWLPTILLTNMLTDDLPAWLLDRLHSPEVFWPKDIGELESVRPLRELGLDGAAAVTEL